MKKPVVQIESAVAAVDPAALDVGEMVFVSFALVVGWMMLACLTGSFVEEVLGVRIRYPILWIMGWPVYGIVLMLSRLSETAWRKL